MKTITLKAETLEMLEQCAHVLPQYMEYAEEMKKIGRGFVPSNNITPEYLLSYLKRCIKMHK